jgi:hypothetical protein
MRALGLGLLLWRCAALRPPLPSLHLLVPVHGSPLHVQPHQHHQHQLSLTSLHQHQSPLSTPPSPSKPSFLSSNLGKRWITGLSLGVLGTIWLASGNSVFTFGFLFASLVAQDEYYTMVRATGVMPAHKTGTLAALACYLSAALLPGYHELALPLSATLLMAWLLLFNRRVASIGEISTSLLGIFYIGMF